MTNPMRWYPHLLATLLVMVCVVEPPIGVAGQSAVTGVPATELASWNEQLRQAGATTKEIGDFEALLRRELPFDLRWRVGSIRAAPPTYFESYVMFERMAASRWARHRAPRMVYPVVVPIRSCESLRDLVLLNTMIEAAAIDPHDTACHIVAKVNHPPASDRVRIFVTLPVQGWNGRFLGTGGGGFRGGVPEHLQFPVEKGYAAAATDAGHEGISGRFALDANRRLQWQEIRDYAYLGIHDMTLSGKLLTQAFYGKLPKYSYFVGGSAGGRQGLMEAQRYPEDYDGILAAYPAINFDRLAPALLWPQVVMLQSKNFVSKAKLDAATAGSVAACDAADGVVDNVIDDPGRCTYDPMVLVGTRVAGETFTAIDAEVVRKIWDGPRSVDGKLLWYGIARGADLSLAATHGSPLIGTPSNIPLEWFQYFLLHDPQWDWTTLKPGEYELLFNQSVDQYRSVIGTDNPDLTRFRDRGGKLIVYHGLADQVIPAQGSIDYYRHVEQLMGGPGATKPFARLFLVPGVDHFLHGSGPSPTRMVDAIVAWVEEGNAPDRLVAELLDSGGKLVRTRPLYPYPQVARYLGKGSTDDADNFSNDGQ